MKNNKVQATLAGNLIGNEIHKAFLRFQTTHAIEKRGGSLHPGLTETHAVRLVQDVNLLSSAETRILIFSEQY